MNPRVSKRLFRRIHVLPSLITLGNFTCGFLAIILCLNALYFSTRAQILEERAAAGADRAALSLPEKADRADAEFGADGAKARRNAMGLHSVAGARARAAFLLHWACIVIFLGMVCDMLDGKVARHMGADSEFGKELDSLADVMTFGVAPAVIVTTLSIAVLPATYAWWSQVIVFGVVFAVCAVLRLARYNIQSGTDKNIFSGLPSPAAAGCVVSAVLFFEGDYGFVDAVAGWLAGIQFFGTETAHVKARLLCLFLLVPGLLMVSEIPYTHVANRYLTGKKSFATLVIAILLIALVWHEPRLMIFLAFNGYMAAGIVLRLLKRNHTHSQV